MVAGRIKGTPGHKFSTFYETVIGKQLYLITKDKVMLEHPELNARFRSEYGKWYRRIKKEQGFMGLSGKKKKVTKKISFNIRPAVQKRPKRNKKESRCGMDCRYCREHYFARMMLWGK